MAQSITAFPIVARPTSGGLSGLWRRARAAAKANAARRLLAEMDDHHLADIGASRMDATMEASSPCWDFLLR